MSQKMVEVVDLYYKYPDGTPALDGVNLSIMEGESVAIVGHNGAGKSTLLKHLNGILRGHGKINIAGLPMGKEHLRTIRSHVGMVFQDPDDQLFCPTVYDDVAFGLINMDMEREQIRQRVAETLANVGLSGFEQRSAHHLSYGQKKRVAVATILSMMPKILVFDEPTSNLDPRNEKIFMELVKSLPGTKIIVSHDLQILFQLCERFVVMSEGKIIEDTTREKFMRNKKLIQEHGLDYTFKCAFCEHRASVTG
jgi:cobalt/nickel transport system ATP-binding protein